MTNPTFGITFQRDDNEPRPAIGADMSVVGLVCVAPDADAEAFPLNTPKLVFSDDSVTVAKLGTAGTAYQAFAAINSQLSEFQRAAKVVVVRVDGGNSVAEALAALTGDANAKTGIHALLDAGSELGVTPRLIMVPGYTGQFDYENGQTAVVSAAKAGGNTGTGALTVANPAYATGVKAGVYQVRCIGGAKSASAAEKAGGNTGDGACGTLTADNDAASGDWRVVCQVAAANGGTFVVYRPDGTFDGLAVVGQAYNSAHGLNFTISDGAADFAVGDEFVVTVADAVPANGGVFSVKDPDGQALANATVGVAYTTQVKFTIADGGTDFAVGDGFDLTVTISGGDALANPVVAALPSVLTKLLGVAVVDGPATTRQAYVDWRETISSERIIPVEPAVKVLDGVDTVVEPASPYIIGTGVAVDYQHDGKPFHSWANRPINGILGPSRTIAFSLTDGATEGQDLLSHNAGIIIRGEAGVDTAIADGGFVYVGTDTCSEDPLWTFYNQVRGRDYIHLTFLRTLRYYLGKFNITVQTIQSVKNTMEFALRDLKADEHILGYQVTYTKDENSPENLRLGKFTIRFAAEEPAPLRQLNIVSSRYRAALDALLDDLLTQLNLAA